MSDPLGVSYHLIRREGSSGVVVFEKIIAGTVRYFIFLLEGNTPYSYIMVISPKADGISEFVGFGYILALKSLGSEEFFPAATFSYDGFTGIPSSEDELLGYLASNELEEGRSAYEPSGDTYRDIPAMVSSITNDVLGKRKNIEVE